MSQMLISYTHRNYTNMSARERTDAILQRSAKREQFFSLAVKLFGIVKERGLRLVMENPWSEQTFLKQNFVLNPAVIDKDRTRRGDYYVKPTAYWFIGCKPTYGESFTQAQEKRRIASLPPGKRAGICGIERSTISADYARNFICDFILGKEQENTVPTLF